MRKGERPLSIAGLGRGFKVLSQKGVGQTDTGTWVDGKAVARGPHRESETGPPRGEFFSSQVLLLRCRCRVGRELGGTRAEDLQCK